MENSRFSSSSHSKRGKSATQANLKIPDFLASSGKNSRRSSPKILRAVCVSSATNKAISCSEPPRFSQMALNSRSSSFKLDLNPCCFFIQTIPFPPKSLAFCPSLSSWLRDNPAPWGTKRAFKTPPAESAPRMTEESTDAPISVRSSISIPKRKSGLSVPYLAMLSSKVNRGKGRSIFTSITAKTDANMSSTKSNTSCSETKLISMSICVNSGCRSARKSSSRKQRTI